MARGESLEDTLRVLERVSDFIVVRNDSQKEQEKASQWIKKPLVNALSDRYHPTEALADMMTMAERVGMENLTKHKACFLGDANNVSRSFALICAIMGIPCAVATPYGRAFPDFPLPTAEIATSTVTFTDDPVEAVRDASFIYTDTWASMGDANQGKDTHEKADKKRLADKKRFIERFMPYQVSAKIVKNARPDYAFMHCLPAYRAQEVTAEIMDGEHSVAFIQAENRVHTIKALLVYLAQG